MLKLFRGATHVVSIIAPLLLFASCGTPALQQTEAPRQNETASNNQRNPSDNSEQSPFFVREVPTNKETAEHQEDRKQQALATKITEYTGIATVLILVFQGVIFICQTRIFSRQTRIFNLQTTIMREQNALMQGQLKATQETATATANTVNLAAATILDLRDLKVQIHSLTAHGQIDYLQVSYNLFNPTSNYATVKSLHVTEQIVGSGRRSDSARDTRNFVISPGKGYDIPVTVGPLTDEQRTLVSKGRLPVAITMRIDFNDPLGNGNTQVLERVAILSQHHGESHLHQIGGSEEGAKSGE